MDGAEKLRFFKPSPMMVGVDAAAAEAKAGGGAIVCDGPGCRLPRAVCYGFVGVGDVSCTRTLPPTTLTFAAMAAARALTGALAAGVVAAAVDAAAGADLD